MSRRPTAPARRLVLVPVLVLLLSQPEDRDHLGASLVRGRREGELASAAPSASAAFTLRRSSTRR